MRLASMVFLRREYPGSKYRAEALFTIGEIYRDDLDDSKQAKATFEDFVKRYPGNSTRAGSAQSDCRDRQSVRGQKPFQGQGAQARAPCTAKSSARERKMLPNLQLTMRRADCACAAAAAGRCCRKHRRLQPHRLPRLTGIRHWSTGDYTRVAIDLEQEVKYQSGRVPHPDRIFFDLYGTKLASDLVGKSFEVDAGFLHKIRVAQYKLNMARVVLDVDDVAEYSAFLLPNPYRLIIDIHGKLPPNQVAGNKETAKPVASEAKPAQSDTKPSQQATTPADDTDSGH